jgi:magnesium chelatase family protein
MVGPPGAGKTMLARRLPSILPPLSDDAALEVTAVHSIAGALPLDSPMIRRPPFQAPHHTASVPSLVGGGSGLARPGAISLAHLGILFLDEVPEFAVRALETLRQPLETGEVVLSRAHGSTRYPARIQLILAANPCPCAHPAGDSHCTCSPLVRRRYQGRLSGPLLDRVDIQVRLAPVTAAYLMQDGIGTEPSVVVAERVAKARAAAAARWAAPGWQTNAEVPGPVLRRRPWRLARTATTELERHVDSGALSARGYDRVLRIAWTIADLDGRVQPDAGDVAEALGLRMGRVQ